MYAYAYSTIKDKTETPGQLLSISHSNSTFIVELNKSCLHSCNKMFTSNTKHECAGLCLTFMEHNQFLMEYLSK